MKLHSLLPLLGVISVLALVQTPLMAQPFPPGFTYDFEMEVQCTTLATTPCPLVGPFTNLLTDGTQDWISDIGGTGSFNTGPSVDHNPGTSTGFYLYTETSGGAPTGTPIELLSPLFDRTGVPVARITFWYHMYGATMGTMHLDLVDQINAGTDGTVATMGLSFASMAATFTPADVGSQIIVSGSAMGNDGTYTIMTYLGPNAVDVDIPFAAAETNLMFSHQKITQDVISSWTDDIDLWQKKVATFCSSSFQNTGNSQAFAVIIRSLKGTSFTSDMAIDDFTYDTPPMHDTGVVSIDSPTGNIPATTYPVTVTIQNFGTATQSNIPIDLVVNAGTPVSEVFPGPLGPCASATHTFSVPADLSTPGPHTITSYTILPMDADPTNDGTTINLTTYALPYPGTPMGDLVLASGVNGAPTSGPGNFIKTATGIDAISLAMNSPTGTFDFQPFVLLAQPFTTGTPPTPTLPGLGVWLDLGQPFAILIDIDPIFTQFLSPQGISYTFIMPLGFAGSSFLFQGACVTPALSLTDGYQIDVM